MAYVSLTALMTYPLVFHWRDAVPGGGGDSWQFYWNLWWVDRALLEIGTSPFFTDAVFHPYGSGLYFHTLNFVPSLLALPVTRLWGLTAGYNFVVLMGFVGGGYGSYRLILCLLQNQEPEPDSERGAASARRLAAFMGGAVFTFSAYHFIHLRGHLDMVSLQWLPLYVHLLFRTWDERRWRYPLLLALTLSLTSLTSWYYALYLLAFSALFVAYRWWLGERRQKEGALKRLAWASLVYAIVVAPVLGPMLLQGSATGRVSDPESDVRSLSVDLLAYVLPSPLHPVWGEAVLPAYANITRNESESVVYLGFVAMGLAVLGYFHSKRTARFWLVATGLFVLLSLGPELRLGGRVLTVAGHTLALPYALFEQLPYGDIPRNPSRFAVMASLGIAVLAAYGLNALWQRSRGMFFAASLAILFESSPAPYPLSRVEIPPFYDWLAERPRGAIVEVPFPKSSWLFSDRMLFQTRHEQPRFGGYLSRSASALPLDGIPGFAQLTALSNEWDDVVVYSDEESSDVSRKILQLYQTGYVVIEKDRLRATELARARSLTSALLDGRAPVYEDERTLAFAVPSDDAPKVGQVFLHLEKGWHYLEHPELEPEPQTTSRMPPRWRWMGDAASIGIYAPGPSTHLLEFSGWSLERKRRLQLFLDGQAFHEVEIPPYFAEHRTPPLSLTPGSHRLELRSLDGTGLAAGAGGRPASFAAVAIALEPVPTLGYDVRVEVHDASEYLGSGWSVLEDAFRWTSAESVDVFFALESREESLLQMHLTPFLVADELEEQRVVAELNGQRIGTLTIVQTGAYELRLPESRLKEANYLKLTLPDAASPSRHLLSDDERTLAVALSWMRLRRVVANSEVAGTDPLRKHLDQGRIERAGSPSR